MRRTEHCIAVLKGLVAGNAKLGWPLVTSSIPHRLILGPLLFDIYFYDLNGVADYTLHVHRQYKSEKSGWFHQLVVLPFRQTSAGWRKGPGRTP